MAVPFLEISGLHGWYGESHVLHGVDLKVDEGEVVTLLGRNGAGRTSTLRAIMGLIGARKGSIKVRGSETVAMATHQIARLGLGYCPEERGIFASLSAEENLLLLDEISEGLAPVIVQMLARTIRMLRERGFTIVMVEQNFRFAAPLADHLYVMEHGRIVESLAAAELAAKMDMLHEYLGV